VLLSLILPLVPCPGIAAPDALAETGPCHLKPAIPKVRLSSCAGSRPISDLSRKVLRFLTLPPTRWPSDCYRLLGFAE